MQKRADYLRARIEMLRSRLNEGVDALTAIICVREIREAERELATIEPPEPDTE